MATATYNTSLETAGATAGGISAYARGYLGRCSPHESHLQFRLIQHTQCAGEWAVG